MRKPGRALALAVLLIVGALGCASSSAPWHVKRGQEGRFREARSVCHKLTDNNDGTVERERFDRCMTRRGWRRKNFFDRFVFWS